MSDDRAVQSAPRIGIVGGGLAGLAAAAALGEHGCRVELFEAKRQLGGRAGSFADPDSGDPIDHCQHVGMGCCTNLIDFCCRTGILDQFRRDKVLHFFGPDGRRHDLRSTPLLGAPLHLARSLLGLGYLTVSERISIGRTLLKMARLKAGPSLDQQTAESWLISERQSAQAISRFWSIVLVSALGDTIDRVSLAAARKVFVDGMMAARDAYHVLVPRAPLSQLYDQIAAWLERHGTTVHCGQAVTKVIGDAQCAQTIELADGEQRAFDQIIVAVPWRRITKLLGPKLSPIVLPNDELDHFAGSPITSLHLWFDCPIMDLPHAVLIDRLSQWVFHHADGENPNEHYYQIVISASHDLASTDREEIVREVVSDLASVWPAARTAELLRWRLITQADAVFSVTPGLDAYRPNQQTPIANLSLAGDWTATGWPATMEGAVRSGRLAAENVLRSLGTPRSLVVNDLPRGVLARMLFGRSGL